MEVRERVSNIRMNDAARNVCTTHIVSQLDRSGGSRAALTLHRALVSSGVKSGVLAAYGSVDLGGAKGIRDGRPAILRRVYGAAESVFSIPGVLNVADIRNASFAMGGRGGIVHLHVTHVAQFGWPMLSWLAFRHPVVWTLHDFWPLTGNCICPLDCQKWRSECFKCPQLDVYPRLSRDTTRFLHRRKRSLIRQMRPVFVAPSEWMRAQTSEPVRALGADIECIPHGIDCDDFAPRDREAARRALDLPPGQRVFLCLNSRWDDPRKGDVRILKDIAAAMESRTTGACIVLLGASLDTAQFDTAHVRFVRFPLAETDARMAEFYGAVDACFSLSRAETFGLGAAESHACGRAVVALKASGLDELLKDPLYGVSVEPGAWGDFVDALFSYAAEESSRREARRRGACVKYSLSAYAARHVELYRKIGAGK